MSAFITRKSGTRHTLLQGSCKKYEAFAGKRCLAVWPLAWGTSTSTSTLRPRSLGLSDLALVLVLGPFCCYFRLISDTRRRRYTVLPILPKHIQYSSIFICICGLYTIIDIIEGTVSSIAAKLCCSLLPVVSEKPEKLLSNNVFSS